MTHKIDTICIIDDDELSRFVLNETIKKNNYADHVLSFGNGYDALVAIKKMISRNEELPDLILVDINMPVMDGCGFMNGFSELRSFIHKEISIYIHSSCDIEEGKAKITNHSSISGFLSKPIDPEVLSGIMEQIRAGDQV